MTIAFGRGKMASAIRILNADVSYDAIIYTGSGLMGREIENIRSCDVVIFAFCLGIMNVVGKGSGPDGTLRA